MRLPLEVFRRVRATVGAGYAGGCRFLSEEAIEGGNTVEDTAYFGVEFARPGMDFLSLSRGAKFDDANQPGVGWSAYPYTAPSGYECMPQYVSDARGPFGLNVEPTAAIGMFLVLHAFSSGTTALTGVEASSNGIPAFKEPRSRNAGITLMWMSGILGTLFLGISFTGPAGPRRPLRARDGRLAARPDGLRGTGATLPFYSLLTGHCA